MCRLALMNRAAVQRFDTKLAAFFTDLERAMGGHGNGVAALWSTTEKVRIWKGTAFTPTQAAMKTQNAIAHGADWVLFHTRMATSGSLTSRHCHPFRHGQLVLAHNGHSFVWNELGSSLGLSDSECITQTWSRLHLPLTTLAEVEGVFLGFHTGKPFVVKGSSYNDLTVSVHTKTGAMLFASELDGPFHRLFDNTVRAGRLLWFGEKLDINKIEPRKHLVTRYTTTSPSTKQKATEASAPTKENPSSSLTLAQLRKWYQQMDQDMASTLDLSAAAPMKKDG